LLGYKLGIRDGFREGWLLEQTILIQNLNILSFAYLGSIDGCDEGCDDGFLEGLTDGCLVGWRLGILDGLTDGNDCG